VSRRGRGSKAVFEGGKWPSWINTYVPKFTGGFWAPEIVYMNDRYYLYYSCSTFGTSVSAIGVATSPTLDQSSADYKWTDQGRVVSSSSAGDVNAIDPSVFKDDNGKVYLTYGSYFNGIGIIELNPATGKVKAGTRLKHIAGGGSSAFEAPYITKEGKYYYLFVNRADCCKGPYSTYYIVTGRSISPTGPFFDKNGINLRGSGSVAGGTTVMVTSGRYIGPGHMGLLRDNGRNLVSTHYYDGNYYGEPKLDISDLQFTHDGWPVISRDLIPAGRYKITNKNSNMVWEAAGCSDQGSVQLIQNNDNGSAACQFWDLTPVGDGYYKISNEPRNESVDLPFCNSLNGINLQTFPWINTYCQKFKIEQLVNGFYVFTSLANPVLSKVIQVPSESASVGTLLDISDFNGSASQQWMLREVNPPAVLDANDIANNGFTARWNTTPEATGYRLDVTTTFVDAAYQTIAEWNFQSGTNTANNGITDNLNKTITATGTAAPVYAAQGNGGQTARATGWNSTVPEKFWEINFTTENYYNLKVSSKQRSSSTGPLHFKLQYK
ncbi:MAG: GH43_5 / GH43_3 / GH43_6 / GH43_7 / GH43 / G H43_4 / GH43_8 / GH43_30 / GH5_35 / GH43_31 / CBM13, partial [uncultured Segetibacter sp.]